jgi:hypothetical protein
MGLGEQVVGATEQLYTRLGRLRRRGQAELTGIVLLFGLISASAIFVFAAGGLIVGDLQEQASVDAAQRTMDVFDDRVTQVAATTETTDVPFENVGETDPTVSSGSTITVSIAGCDQSVDKQFNVVKYELDDQALVYEGGGIWKHTPDGPVVREAPSLSYDRNGDAPVFRMRLTDIVAEDPRPGSADVVFDEAATRAFREDVSELLANCADEGEDLVVTVESQQRSTAWASAFEQTLHPERYSEVDVTRAGSTTTATIRGIVNDSTDRNQEAVTVPAGEVKLSILGTEASIHRTGDGECDSGDCEKGWLPVTSTVLFDGEPAHRFPESASQSGERTLEHNLNRPADHGDVITYETELEESTSVTLEASLYACDSFGFDTGYTDAPDVTGGPWDDKRCSGGLSEDPMVTVNPIENPEAPNLVALRDGDVVKNLEQPGVGQTSVNEMLDGKIDEDTGELELGDNQAVFLGELTESDAAYEDVDPDTSGDPNFNDFVVLLETSPGTELEGSGPAIRIRVEHVVLE